MSISQIAFEEVVNISTSPSIDSSFGEGESLLSFGQRQLFCLARAVLKGAICLVLDEATSNLDSETEKQFLQCSNDAFRGKTVITIAVRLHFVFLLYLPFMQHKLAFVLT